MSSSQSSSQTPSSLSSLSSQSTSESSSSSSSGAIPQYLCVEGAGTAVANGTYTWDEGQLPDIIWRKQDGENEHDIRYDSGYWLIMETVTESSLYISQGEYAASPVGLTYTSDIGDDPAPSVLSGTCQQHESSSSSSPSSVSSMMSSLSEIPQYVCASGAGDTEYNGTYEWVSNQYETGGGDYQIAFSAVEDKWVFQYYTGDILYGATTTGGDSPIGLTYEVGIYGGAEPAPTLVAGSC